MLVWWNNCNRHLPIISRAALATFGNMQVKIGSQLVSTLFAFLRNRGLVSIQSGLLKKFKEKLKIKGQFHNFIQQGLFNYTTSSEYNLAETKKTVSFNLSWMTGKLCTYLYFEIDYFVRECKRTVESRNYPEKKSPQASWSGQNACFTCFTATWVRLQAAAISTCFIPSDKIMKQTGKNPLIIIN